MKENEENEERLLNRVESHNKDMSGTGGTNPPGRHKRRAEAERCTQGSTMITLLFLSIAAASLLAGARNPVQLVEQVGAATPQNVSLDTTSCPGKSNTFSKEALRG